MISRVVGNYKVVEKIGEGGVGEVYKGVDLMLEREVAIKVLRPELARKPQVVERFRSEAVMLAKLIHPNIATLFQFIRQADDYFMVMEYVGGETLDERIKRCGAIECERAVPLFCQALDGLGYAHRRGIIHRDIKLANLMLTEDDMVKVTDFGIARVLGSVRLTREGHLVGTIEYMSPEQIKGQEADVRSDIYSLGIVLYEMLTGRVPFASDSEYDLMKSQIEEAPRSPRDFAPQIATAIEQAILRALAKNREDRFQTAGEFRTAILHGANLPQTAFQNQAPLHPPSSPAVSRVEANPLPVYEEVPTESELASTAEIDFSTTATTLGKETRLTPDATTERQHSAAASVLLSPPNESQTQASLFSRLDWMQYSAFAVVLLVLLGLPVALISFGEGSPPTEKTSTIDQPAPSPSEEPTTRNVSNPEPSTVQGTREAAPPDPAPVSSLDQPLIVKPIDPEAAGISSLPPVSDNSQLQPLTDIPSLEPSPKPKPIRDPVRRRNSYAREKQIKEALEKLQ